MTPRELADLLLSPLMRQYRDILLDRMTMGMTYQAGKIEEIEQYCTNENSALFMPRLYTCDSFNTTLMIENVPNLPPYHVSPFVFSTHMSLAEHESEKISEWVVDLYPKGVWFKKCYFIGWQGTIEVPEYVKSTVRLSLTCRTATKESLKVNIGILLYGTQSGCEHIMSVVKKVHYFDHQDCIMVIDDLIPFQEFNNTLSDFGVSVRESQYYVGSTNDLKIGIIITPHSA